MILSMTGYGLSLIHISSAVGYIQQSGSGHWHDAGNGGQGFRLVFQKGEEFRAKAELRGAHCAPFLDRHLRRIKSKGLDLWPVNEFKR